MLIVYGSEMCPNCAACRYNFDRQNVAYEFIDINKSLANLKALLKYRDSSPLFDEAKAVNKIGIPVLEKEDGTITLDWKGYLMEQGLTVEEIPAGEACAADGKRC